MNYRKFIKYIKSYGFHFYRSCKSSHDLYINEEMSAKCFWSQMYFVKIKSILYFGSELGEGRDR